MIRQIIAVNILIVILFSILTVINSSEEDSTESPDTSDDTDDNSDADSINRTARGKRFHFDDSHCSCDRDKRNFGRFWSYTEIEDYLTEMAKSYPHRVQLKSLDTTYENRTIYAVKIGVEIDGNNIVFVTAGMYAKEWNGIMMAVYIIYLLVECDLYEEVGLIDWLILPVVNPDGFAYSFENPQHRMWIKNRKPCDENTHHRCLYGQDCGVNVDKNFQFMFPASVGSSRNPCSDFYPGTEDGSEHESNATMNMLYSVKNRIKLYLGLRTYGSLIVYPYAAGVEVFVDNPEEIEYVARLAARALNQHTSTDDVYSFGSYANTIVPETGTCLDYAKGTLQVQYTYYIHLRGLHQPEEREILPIISECFYGICAMVKYIYDKYPPPKKFLRELKGLRRRRNRKNASTVNSFPYATFVAIISAYCFVGS